MSKTARRRPPVDSDDDVHDLDFGAPKPAKKRTATAAAKRKPKKPTAPKKPRKPRQPKQPPKARKPKATIPATKEVDDGRSALELTEEYSTALILQSLSQRSHASYYQKVNSQMDTPTTTTITTITNGTHADEPPLQIVFHHIPYPPPVDHVTFAIDLDHNYSAEAPPTVCEPPETFQRALSSPAMDRDPTVTETVAEEPTTVDERKPEVAEVKPETEVKVTSEEKKEIKEMIEIIEAKEIKEETQKEGTPTTEQDSGYMSGDQQPLNLNIKTEEPPSDKNNNECAQPTPVVVQPTPVVAQPTPLVESPPLRSMKKRWLRQADEDAQAPKKRRISTPTPIEVIGAPIVASLDCLERLEHEVIEEREVAAYQLHVAQFSNPESLSPPRVAPLSPALTVTERDQLMLVISDFHQVQLQRLRDLNGRGRARPPFKLDLKLDYNVDQMSVQINHKSEVIAMAAPPVPVHYEPFAPPSSLTPDLLRALQTCTPTRLPQYVAHKAAKVDAHFGAFGGSRLLAFDFPPLEPALDFYARRQLLTTPTLKSTNNGICTKTMGADPRLNPALIVDDKEEIQPKKKLSLDQYRKRKTVTVDCP